MLIQAWKEKELVGTILVVFAGRCASYLAGATRRECSHLCPAEFMHMSAMRLAKERGMEVYDLVNWGSSEGLVQFKKGFRPREHRWADPITKVELPKWFYVRLPSAGYRQ